MSNVKFRKAIKHFFEGTTVSSKYCIEVMYGRKWTLLGDGTDILKFNTEQERDAYLTNIKDSITQQPVVSCSLREG